MRFSVRKHLGLEITRKLQNDLIKEHPLKQLFWECTLRCNLHCRHCGSDCKHIATTPDMPKEDFFKVLDSVKQQFNPHKVFVILTGGEPLMRPDLEECGKGIYEREFPWGMVSNGLALTPERYRRLLNRGLRSMTISLDGLHDSHNWMRGNIHSFDNATRAIEMVVHSNEIVFDVVTCANKRNLNELPKLKEYLIGIGLKSWRIFTVFPMGRAAKDPMMHLDNDEFRQVFEFIKATKAEGKIDVNYGCEGFLGEYENEVRNHFFFCQAGATVGSVLCDGSISACPSIRANYHQGNIYEDDFLNVWNNKFLPYRDRSWMKKDDCADCKYFRYCRGNGMHLRDDEGKLLLCHMKRLGFKK
ncbi:MAG: TIGR04133 family radical SAM/SPASM protein [Phocaeicola sp.]|uniref:TIGR04133 family radical SAM/SPASM protein n=1 Tax=Phocaeicola sp. TaxID=2773926 RepID=UPI003F9F946C